ncbi:MAG: tRNA (uridine(34)/cytosine(34)/5-carboxymethylaminomethyluridine(34)-2'-O)-methyltransferase TrmL [Clostridia bacterium]
MINIVLVEPEIPANTGNIARTCAATGSQLHLVRPLGFELSDKHLKRAGLDYWHLLNVRMYDSIDEFFEKNSGGDFYYLSTKAPQSYTEKKFKENDYFVFGKETRGLPEPLLYEHPDKCIRIPMRAEARSLNLANSVAIIAYEALRQIGFDGLLGMGKMGSV